MILRRVKERRGLDRWVESLRIRRLLLLDPYQTSDQAARLGHWALSSWSLDGLLLAHVFASLVPPPPLSIWGYLAIGVHASGCRAWQDVRSADDQEGYGEGRAEQ